MLGLGVPFFELYAATEVPPITTSRPVREDIGTVGRPLPGVELRLADDGEILVRHPGRPPGYHRRPAQTAALLDADGWARTGDLGSLDAAGRLRLGGRRDERFANAFGHNIDPARIEAGLRAESPLIAQACVIGDRRPHLVALLTLAPGADRDDGAVAAAVARANAKLPEPGRIRRFRVLEDTLEPGGDELTPTLKLRRSAIHSRYADAIEALYV
jgi:long-subunit acyl-CoA synthetase (AMP-forming)